MLHFFTSAAINYIPKVRLLLDSIREFHPEAKIHLALADERPANLAIDEMFDSVWSPADLGIENWKSWAFKHTIVELATAIKPFVLEKLLVNDGDRVIYMDPDTVLYSRLDDVLQTLEHASIGLTPHQTTPEDDWRAVVDNEICSLQHGIYNLGFVAVAATDAGRVTGACVADCAARSNRARVADINPPDQRAWPPRSRLTVQYPAPATGGGRRL